MKIVPTWTLVQKISAPLLKKATLGLILIYVVYYLKVGGFDTAPLEITLAGCLLLMTSLIVGVIFMPMEISRFQDGFAYECYLMGELEKQNIPISYIENIIRINPVGASEAKTLGYVFDEKFGYSTSDLRATLGDSGFSNLVAKVLYARIENSKPLARGVVTLGVVVGVTAMYWRPLGMIYSIYTS